MTIQYISANNGLDERILIDYGNKTKEHRCDTRGLQLSKEYEADWCEMNQSYTLVFKVYNSHKEVIKHIAKSKELEKAEDLLASFVNYNFK